MSVSEQYLYSKENLETQADFVKRQVVGALVIEGLLEEEVADEWCENHTLIYKAKGFFRTLSDKWFKQQEDKDSMYWIVVKKV